MITASTPYEATFQNGPESHTRMPVIAWDDEGRALVVEAETGYLVPANGLPNFLGLEDADEPYVAVLPGAGWRIAGRARPDLAEPVLGWAINRNGYGSPLVVDADGTVVPLNDYRVDARAISPDEP